MIYIIALQRASLFPPRISIHRIELSLIFTFVLYAHFYTIDFRLQRVFPIEYSHETQSTVSPLHHSHSPYYALMVPIK